MRIFIGGLLAASFLLAALLASPARAITILPDSPAYELRVSTEAALLVDPASSLAHMKAVWKTTSELRVLRSMPVFRLENTSTGDFDITELSIDINELGFMFDTVDLLDGPTGFLPFVSVLTPTDLIFGGDTSSVVNFSFLSQPLKAGESFLFSLRIVPDVVTSTLPDYRDILWNGGVQSDNALVQVSFVGIDLPEVPLFNYPFAAAIFDSPSDNTGGESMRFDGMMPHGTDVGLYEFAQTSVVPEPNSFFLASIGLGALLLLVRRGEPRAAISRA